MMTGTYLCEHEFLKKRKRWNNSNLPLSNVSEDGDLEQEVLTGHHWACCCFAQRSRVSFGKAVQQDLTNTQITQDPYRYSRGFPSMQKKVKKCESEVFTKVIGSFGSGSRLQLQMVLQKYVIVPIFNFPSFHCRFCEHTWQTPQTLHSYDQQHKTPKQICQYPWFLFYLGHDTQQPIQQLIRLFTNHWILQKRKKEIERCGLHDWNQPATIKKLHIIYKSSRLDPKS